MKFGHNPILSRMSIMRASAGARGKRAAHVRARDINPINPDFADMRPFDALGAVQIERDRMPA